MARIHKITSKEIQKMKTDYSYCLNEGSCIHRRGCRRWIKNYEIEDVEALLDTGRDNYIDDSGCVPNYEDIENENNFNLLDRFRNSNEEGKIKCTK